MHRHILEVSSYFSFILRNENKFIYLHNANRFCSDYTTETNNRLTEKKQMPYRRGRKEVENSSIVYSIPEKIASSAKTTKRDDK